MQVEKRLLHVSDVASLLEISSQTVYQMIHEGALSAFKAGTAWKIPAAAVEEFINSRVGT